jgi:hypothetical protein
VLQRVGTRQGFLKMILDYPAFALNIGMSLSDIIIHDRQRCLIFKLGMPSLVFEGIQK